MDGAGPSLPAPLPGPTAILKECHEEKPAKCKPDWNSTAGGRSGQAISVADLITVEVLQYLPLWVLGGDSNVRRIWKREGLRLRRIEHTDCVRFCTERTGNHWTLRWNVHLRFDL